MNRGIHQRELCREFVNGRTKQHGKTALSLWGDKLYSYDTPIVIRMGDAYAVNPNKYGATTSKHQHYAKWELAQEGYVDTGKVVDVAHEGWFKDWDDVNTFSFTLWERAS